ncbi:MAG: nucleotidyltransferase family protein [Ginsengibacter sp.]
MKAMILAAGLGTRLKPFTNNHPKALAVVNGKTLLQRNIEYLASYGFQEVIVNVHHFADQIINVLEKNQGFGSEITISDETDEVLETGGGIKKSAWFLGKDTSPCLVMNVDILTDLNLKEMLSYHIEKKPIATLAVTLRDTSRYFLFDKKEQLCGWKNVKTGEEKISKQEDTYVPKAFSGIQILSPEIFTSINQTGKFSMVDIYLELAKSSTILGYEHDFSKFVDAGKPESILKAESMFP